jgi:hypothetical protein
MAQTRTPHRLRESSVRVTALGGGIALPLLRCDGGLGHLNLKNIIEAVEGTAERDPPCQLDDLWLAEMPAEAGENLVPRPAPVVRNRGAVLDHQLVDVVEFGMVRVVEEALRPGLGHALHRELRRAVGDAVLAFSP